MSDFKQYVSWILLILITLNACQSPLSVNRLPVKTQTVNASDLTGLKLEPGALEQLAKQGFSDISFTTTDSESTSSLTQTSSRTTKSFKKQDTSKGFWEEEHSPWTPWDQPHHLSAYTHSKNTSDGKNHDVYYGYAMNDSGGNPTYHTSWVPLAPTLTHGFYA